MVEVKDGGSTRVKNRSHGWSQLGEYAQIGDLVDSVFFALRVGLMVRLRWIEGQEVACRHCVCSRSIPVVAR